MHKKNFDQYSGFETTNPFAYSHSSNFSEIIPTYSRVFLLEKILHHQRWLLRKSLRPDFLHDGLWRQAIIREFEFGFKFTHRNLPQYFSLEQGHNNQIFLIREWIDGMNLAEWVKKSPSKEEKMNVLSQLAEVLVYLHGHLIYHRDLSPGNIMISHVGCVVKLIDTGFSAHGTEEVLGSGTKGFAPEEQLNGSPPHPAQDIYAFGRLAQYLFREMDSLPPSIKQIIFLCLKDEPQDRPSGMDEIFRLLKDNRETSFHNKFSTLLILKVFFVLVLIFSLAFIFQKLYTTDNKIQQEKLSVSTVTSSSNVIPIKENPHLGKDFKVHNSNEIVKSSECAITIDSAQVCDIINDFISCSDKQICLSQKAGLGRKKNLMLEQLSLCSRDAIDRFTDWKGGRNLTNMQAILYNKYFSQRLSYLQDSLRSEIFLICK